MSAPALPTPIGYAKLRGNGSHLISRIKLYQGPDHLLLITLTGFTERYRRFFFQDIQAFTVQRTLTGLIWNLLCGWLSAMCLVPALLADPPLAAVLYFLGGLFLLGLGANVWAGPTCAFYIQTAVQQQRVHSIGRLRLARRTMTRLRPLIVAVQPIATPGDGAPPSSPEAPPTPALP